MSHSMLDQYIMRKRNRDIAKLPEDEENKKIDFPSERKNPVVLSGFIRSMVDKLSIVEAVNHLSKGCRKTIKLKIKSENYFTLFSKDWHNAKIIIYPNSSTVHYLEYAFISNALKKSRILYEPDNKFKHPDVKYIDDDTTEVLLDYKSQVFQQESKVELTNHCSFHTLIQVKDGVSYSDITYDASPCNYQDIVFMFTNITNHNLVNTHFSITGINLFTCATYFSNYRNRVDFFYILLRLNKITKQMYGFIARSFDYDKLVNAHYKVVFNDTYSPKKTSYYHNKTISMPAEISNEAKVMCQKYIDELSVINMENQLTLSFLFDICFPYLPYFADSPNYHYNFHYFDTANSFASCTKVSEYPALFKSVFGYHSWHPYIVEFNKKNPKKAISSHN